MEWEIDSDVVLNAPVHFKSMSVVGWLSLSRSYVAFIALAAYILV